MGGVIGAAGAIESSQQEAANQEYNASIARQQASTVRAEAMADATTYDISAQQRIGQEVANLAGSGVTMTGSALSILAMSTASAKLDEQAILYKGAAQARGYINQAALDVYAGKIAKRQGYFSAVSTALGAGGKAGSTLVTARAARNTGSSASASKTLLSGGLSSMDYGSLTGGA